MRPILRLLAALTVFIGASLVVVAAPASAVPTVAFSVSSLGLKVGEPATYTADVVCDVEPCRYQWRWYRVLGNDRLGTTMGEGPELTYAFSSAGLKHVVLKVTNATRTHGFAVSGQVLRVMLDGEDPPPPPTDPIDPPVDEPVPVEPSAPPVTDTTPAETPAPPATDTPAADPSTSAPLTTDPVVPPTDSTCQAPADPTVPDPAAPTTEPAAPVADPTCVEPVASPAPVITTEPAPTTATAPTTEAVPTTDAPTEPPAGIGDDPTADPATVTSPEPVSYYVL